jgi:hypothetical protein
MAKETLWYKHWIWRKTGYQIKTWTPARMFLFRIDHDDPQGDKLLTITLHLFGRAFQFWRLS